ncbi:Adh transcription factor 1 [Sarotherodon galilaeus]
MLTLIWVILLLADKGSGTPQCPKSNSSITLSERNVSAQAGLCVVLACSFTTDNGDVENITWYKHDGNVNKTIFDSSNNTKADSEFQGRVSLLEPNQKNKNCSIIINDLTESDSGSYQVVVKTKPPCTLISDANVTVTVTLSEKPTLEIPEITEGELTTLTCSAPGLCPGSTPNITWIWSGSGQSVYEIKENNTDFKSTLTFNASAKHNGGQVTCKVTCNVTFKSVTTNETKTLNVKYSSSVFADAPRILNDSNCVAQSKVLTCVCISEGFPSPTIKWPHLESHTEYCVTTNVSNTRVTSTITVSHDHCHNSTIECVSSNNLYKQDPKVIAATLRGFLICLIGIILSAVVAFLVTKSNRKNWRRSENLESVTTEAVPMRDNRLLDPGDVTLFPGVGTSK